MNQPESAIPHETLALLDAARAPARTVSAWIWLGVYALLAAGLLALLLALSRTPFVQDIVPGSQWFRVALVAHVDLSVLVWFIAGAGTLWSLHGGSAAQAAGRVAIAFAVIGTVMISVAPFAGAGRPLMNNYVPVLEHPWFYTGLGAVAAGLVVQAGTYLVVYLRRAHAKDEDEVISFALGLAALSALLAVACVGMSYRGLPAEADGEYYFDLLFWGGGHVLQFTHTILMLVASMLLLRGSGSQLRGGYRLHAALFTLTVMPLAAVPWLNGFPVSSREHILGFTELMRWGGTASIPLLLLVIASLRTATPLAPTQRPLRAALLCSISLFAGGGIMGFMIRGSNTVIPAHYHGSIVGVTLAYMGVVYLLLPRLGRPLTMPRAAYWQPYVYGIGQRKTAGAAQGLGGLQQVLGMGMMGFGGLIAVIGGVMFLVVVLAALLSRRDAA